MHSGLYLRTRQTGNLLIGLSCFKLIFPPSNDYLFFHQRTTHEYEVQRPTRDFFA